MGKCCSSIPPGLHSVETAKPHIKTGDIFLVSSKPLPGTLFINCGLMTRFTHVGFIYVDEESGEVYACHIDSTHHMMKEPLAETVSKGAYREMKIRPLKAPLSEEQCEILRQFVDENKETEFDDLTTMIKAGVDGCCDCFGLCSNTQEEGHDDQMFCSELVATAYQRAGLIKSARPTDEYSPEDLYTDYKDLFGPKFGIKIEPEPGCVFCCECCWNRFCCAICWSCSTPSLGTVDLPPARGSPPEVFAEWSANPPPEVDRMPSNRV